MEHTIIHVVSRVCTLQGCCEPKKFVSVNSGQKIQCNVLFRLHKHLQTTRTLPPSGRHLNQHTTTEILYDPHLMQTTTFSVPIHTGIV